MNTKQKFLTAIAVWIVISMILSYIDMPNPFDPVATFFITLFNRLSILVVFILLRCEGAERFSKPATTGVAAYIVGLIAAVVKLCIDLQNVIQEGVPEQAFTAVTSISALNLLYVLLGFFALYNIGRRAKKGSAFRISALIAAWWPLLSYLSVTTATITHLHQLFFGGAGSFFFIFSLVSVTIGHLSLAIWIFVLAKKWNAIKHEVPEEKDGNTKII